jgi:membrane protein implicated in regulation of membrane protease activity
MNLTGKQIQWTAIVLGATCYFFLGALTELALPIQFGAFVGVAVVAPAIVTRSVSLQQPPVDGDEDDEYKF